MAWALFGESLTLLMMAGVALTVIGVALVVRPVDELKERPT
jgi:drug/metabolite transporter (DMT)-like permease